MNLLAAIGALAALLLILGGPLPLCRAVVRHGLPARVPTVGEQWLAVALLWLAVQLSGATLLATLGQFTLGNVLLCQALLLGGGFLWHTGLPILGALCERANLPFWTTLFTALLLFGNLLSQPITDYDSLYYHLPFVASLHATGGLHANAVAAVVAWYPFGWETLATLLVLPLQSDLLVTLPNLLAWGMWGVAVHRLGRRLGAPAYAVSSVTLLLLTQPLVVDQLNTVRVDLALAAIFSCGLTFTLAYQQTRQQGYGWLALLCLPLLAALKSSGLIYGLLLLLILLMFWLRRAPFSRIYATPAAAPVRIGGCELHDSPQSEAVYSASPDAEPSSPSPVRSGGCELHEMAESGAVYSASPDAEPSSPSPIGSENEPGPGIALLPLLVIIGFTVVAAGVWYFNNWLVYGNPLGAVALQLGGWTLFPGALTGADVRRTMLLSLFLPTDPNHWRALASQLWQQGWLPGGALALLALTSWLPPARQPKRWHVRSGLTLLYILLVAIYWVTPYSGDDGSYAYQLTAQWLGQSMRFALAAAGVLTLLAALGGGALPQAKRWLPPVAVTLALLTLAQRSTLYLLAVVGFVVLVVGWYGLRWLTSRRGTINRVPMTDLQPFVAKHNQLLLIGMVIILLGGSFALQPLRAQRRYAAYGALPQVIEQRTPPQATIAALYSHQSYLAAGEQMQRRVVQAPLTIKDVDELRAWLTEQHIDFLLLGPLLPQWQADGLPATLKASADFTLLYDGLPNHPQLYARTRP